MLKHRQSSLIILLLAVITLAIYWQVGGHSFIHLDDNDYVTANYQVRSGLTREGVAWSFSTFHADNWHPLTWLSHMLDVTLFGLEAGWHHRVNVLFHGMNAILLFLVLKAMTGATWRSAFVAALFATHPLHVESVAWVAERKDVLSTFFWMLSMAAYVYYVRSPGWRRYLGVMAAFGLGLMSKPMLVTLPFVFLLLDYWPLGRMAKPGQPPPAVAFPPVPLRHLVLEKVPLILFSIASSVVTLLAQGKGGAITTLESLPAGYRVANALVSYFRYLGMTAWPSSLAVYYPLSIQDLHAWMVIGSGCALAGFSVAAVLRRRLYPWMIVGWLWYLGTLIPVIGLAQMGSQAMADRYTYVPLIGVFIIVTWGACELLKGWRFRRQVLGVLGALVLTGYSAATWNQIGYWRDSITLFTRAQEVTKKNWFVLNNLGVSYWVVGRHSLSIACYRESLRINPYYDIAKKNLAEALKVTEGIAAKWNNSGVAYGKEGRYPEAIACYEKALQVRPDYADAWYNLALAFQKTGEHARAAEAFSAAIRAGPNR
jgi:tetratricopeptide (TPR) repeat protein